VKLIGVFSNWIEKPESSVEQVIARPVLSLCSLFVARLAAVIQVCVIVDQREEFGLRTVVVNLIEILSRQLVFMDCAVRAVAQKIFPQIGAIVLVVAEIRNVGSSRELHA
jgi:hypothetical protein